MKVFLEFTLVLTFVGLVVATSYQYERMQKLNNKNNPKFSFKHLLQRKTYEYPQTLPPSSSRRPMREPYASLYQGARVTDDRRVFRRAFDYPPAPVGHQIVCHDLLDCDISFLSVETKGCIPIILRGGAGYRHFTVVVRANPGTPLEGIIRAYCRKIPDEET